MKNVGVIGVGGVGGFFGGKLRRLHSHESGTSISFIARGEHLRMIQQFGLLLRSEQDGDLVCTPSLATDDFQRLPPLDLCLVCVKAFDLPSVLSHLADKVGENTVVLPLLNGVDIYSRIRAVISKGIVLPACVYVGTHLEGPGKVFQKGGACKILFGPDPLRPDFAPSDILELFDQAGIKSEWTLNIHAEIWKKFIFICAYGLMSAAYGKTLGEIFEDEALRGKARMIMLEAVSLASGAGVALPADIVEASLLKAGSFPYDAKTSFQRDYEHVDRNDERDLFVGAMVRMGDELGIGVPTISAISTLLADRKPHPAF